MKWRSVKIVYLYNKILFYIGIYIALRKNLKENECPYSLFIFERKECPSLEV